MPPGSPFDQPEYVLPSQVQAEAADLRALEALDAADFANEASSHYVLTSVLFASVLFLAGIASKLPNRKCSTRLSAWPEWCSWRHCGSWSRRQ